MSISENLEKILNTLPASVKLVAVSKFKPEQDIAEAYANGQRIFGESRALELRDKYNNLPKDIEWHFIGHLQTNKIKYIIPFVSLIHSVDSVGLLKEIDAYAKKAGRVVECLIQVHISQEETKFGFSYEECVELFNNYDSLELENVKIVGLMGMATNTDDMEQVRLEFKSLKSLYDRLNTEKKLGFSVLSMGMSSDYELAIKEGSTMVRIGSSIFGSR